MTGVVDAVSFLGLGHIFTANMTGNIVFLVFAIGGGTGVSVARSLTALSAFACGGICGGRINTRDLTPACSLLTAMCFESLLLLLAVAFTALSQFNASSVAYIVIVSTGPAECCRSEDWCARPDDDGAHVDNYGLGGRMSSIVAMCIGATRGAVLLGRFGLAAALDVAALVVAGLSLFLYSSLRHRSA